MGFFSKLFGGGTSLEGLRKAVAQKRFADARVMAEELLEQDDLAEKAEVEQLQAAAGDGLAQLNLDEARGCQRNGDAEQASEHFELALQQVFSSELKKEIEKAQKETPLKPQVEAPVKKHSGGSCASCGPQEMTPLSGDDIDLPDLETQLELTLVSYPPEIAERYRQKGNAFLQAFMYSQSGEDKGAIDFWKQVPDKERDDLYWFELGASQVRAGQPKQGRKSLEKAVELNPTMIPATEMLIQVQVSLGDANAALKRLEKMLDEGQQPDFCHVQMTLVRLQQKKLPQALEHARNALAIGVADPGFMQLAASLMEQSGELDEAEALLRRIPAGSSCGGSGMNLHLAEFLLRQKRELGKVLDTFNAACRQDPQNPRWQLRAAQTYIARNWKKEGVDLLSRVVDDPNLEPQLQQEAREWLAAQKG
ncbi:Tetratricopeptide repeat-containing protein [Malonomonas rubra DSM 5091]|uniref:Tetratricopeptide repeat-containing protein n=1 Tax=Malonomonas rubra DSM 5091 TaxID=1122189 RepID=A0A1M6FJ97_MALRU|nr:tetratricopeptide repeat protein [Malonomonas rubra]SHI97818.1 Tetratricopeptide repeat-containing protein [Malonomonas rubra DSM 5091]